MGVYNLYGVYNLWGCITCGCVQLVRGSSVFVRGVFLCMDVLSLTLLVSVLTLSRVFGVSRSSGGGGLDGCRVCSGCPDPLVAVVLMGVSGVQGVERWRWS